MPQNIWNKLLGNKKNQWLILLLVGILLVVIAIPTKSGTEEKSVGDLKEWSTSETEQRLENILSQMQGIGEVHVMITYKQDNQVEGVVVVAEGGEQGVIVQKITEVVRALFDVDSHKIKVIDSK
jgi:stage III sporulation protein AG